jgi:hypothetical protein
MSKIKATNELQARKQLEAIKKGLSDQIDFTIDKGDKDSYVVAQVKRRHRPSKEDYVSVATKQIYDQRGYNNVKDKAKGLGLYAIILIHDPVAQKALEAEEEARLKAEQEQKEANAKPKAGKGTDKK